MNTLWFCWTSGCYSAAICSCTEGLWENLKDSQSANVRACSSRFRASSSLRKPLQQLSYDPLPTKPQMWMGASSDRHPRGLASVKGSQLHQIFICADGSRTFAPPLSCQSKQQTEWGGCSLGSTASSDSIRLTGAGDESVNQGHHGNHIKATHAGRPSRGL